MFEHKGRGSAIHKKIAILAIVLTLFLPYYVTCTTYIVGGGSRWSFHVESWSDGKKFKEGDELVFFYDVSFDNVVIVDAKGYENCRASPSSPTYTSGNDRLTLSKGPNYFISTIPGHCENGVKVATNASA